VLCRQLCCTASVFRLLIQARCTLLQVLTNGSDTGDLYLQQIALVYISGYRDSHDHRALRNCCCWRKLKVTNKHFILHRWSLLRSRRQNILRLVHRCGRVPASCKSLRGRSFLRHFQTAYVILVDGYIVIQSHLNQRSTPVIADRFFLLRS